MPDLSLRPSAVTPKPVAHLLERLRPLGLGAVRIDGDPTTVVTGITHDSRLVARGDLYVARAGENTHGIAHVGQAVAAGAVAVLTDPASAGAATDAGATATVVVDDPRPAMGPAAAWTYDDPSRAMTLFGVTGTNGKTTTTYLVESILAAAGARPGVIGTVNYRYGGRVFDSPYTTPTPAVLHQTFAEMLAAGCTHVVMEVSSAALSMDRLAGLAFAVGAFSNLTQDHLDVHGTMEAYRDAKRLLFATHLAESGTAVVNVDDPEGAGMGAAAGAHRVLRVSAEGTPAEIAVEQQESTVRGIHARVRTPRGTIVADARPLVGHYNVENIALAIGIAEALGLDHDAIARGIAELPGVPGRVERVANDRDLDILVDYAHTPDALAKVLDAMRPAVHEGGRLVCVFGAGGDRDRGKRAPMGEVAGRLADRVIVTSDNPRSEDPREIAQAIAEGLAGAKAQWTIDLDRAHAIGQAIADAHANDVVVVAGKGHEDYQEANGERRPFADARCVAEALSHRRSR
jgi:UDP-N-acetylmuramyl-tripeptide synthetase